MAEIGYVKPREISREMEEAYLDYAMSVIVSRALPDVRDGLKPVHRRILYAMYDLGLTHSVKFRKSALVVGEVLGKYHPHGDISVYDALARMAQNFSLRYPLIDGQGNFGCFTKETKIRLTDGRNLSFEELIKEYQQGKRNFTFTIGKNNQIEIAEIQHPRLTRKNVEIIEVTLDNDETIRCTPNHRFMLRDGTYKVASELQESDALMPLYHKPYEGPDRNLIDYEQIYQPDSSSWTFTHHLADNFNLINNIYARGRGRIRHYIEVHPEKRVEFSKRATATLKRLWQDPAHEKRMRVSIIKGNKNHKINRTGLIKFMNVCRWVIQKGQKLTKENFETARAALYHYGRATSWNTGIKKYFNNDIKVLTVTIQKNHKVKSVHKLQERADVYDLTIEKTHNFCLAAGIFVHNSVDGDSPAAMRYTETRLTALAEETLKDIEKDTVNFIDNYDATRQEPKVLPSAIPQLLLNGTMGIAVGMATNIPPHNLNEVIDAASYLVKHPRASIEDLLEFIKGPDFPTGGIIYSKKDIAAAYATGRGPIITRGRAEIVEDKKGRLQIIITEIPYQVNKSAMLEKIAELVTSKKIDGIRDLRDESDKEGMRVVIELKNDAVPQKILNNLYKHTDLQRTFHLNMLALVDGIQPQVLSLKAVLEYYLKHREVVVVRRTKYDLLKAQERAHILEGLKKALDNIDEIIKTIKKSEDRDTARKNLVAKFKFTDIQANAILEMKLATLANLERKKIEDEFIEKKKLIKELNLILKSRDRILEIIYKGLQDIKTKYGDERRTKVVATSLGEFREEDLIPLEEAMIVLTDSGYVKRMNPTVVRVQHRGGKGMTGMSTKEEDAVTHFVSCKTHDNALFFTNTGRVFQTKVWEIPEASRQSKGKAVVNFLALGSDEKINAILTYNEKNLKEKGVEKYFVMATKNGHIKKTSIADFGSVRRSGLIAIKLKKDDSLQWVRGSSGEDSIIMITSKGQAIKFSEKDTRPLGRATAGVIGVRLHKDDHVIGMDIINNTMAKDANAKIMVIMENGFGKKTLLKFYKKQHRGGSGVKTAKITAKTGVIVAAFAIQPDAKEIIAISKRGTVIRVSLDSISTVSRVTQGVRIMRVEPDDKVVSATLL